VVLIVKLNYLNILEVYNKVILNASKIVFIFKISLNSLRLSARKYTFVISTVKCSASFLLQIGIYPADTLQTLKIFLEKEFDAFWREDLDKKDRAKI